VVQRRLLLIGLSSLGVDASAADTWALDWHGDDDIQFDEYRDFLVRCIQARSPELLTG